MDPICHTLVGAALAQAGLKERSRFATATLVIGANLPDVDGITYLLGESLFWRRGWTHGVLALAVWPVVLTGCMVACDRLFRRREPAPGSPPFRPWALSWMSALAVATHPTLDFLNNYGLRWLMPFDGRWFYGDALFIVDPWISSALALGAAISWRLRARARGRRDASRNDAGGPGGVTRVAAPSAAGRRWMRPAQVSLVGVALYAASMLVLGQTGRGYVRESLETRGTKLAREPMVAPVFANPSLRHVVADDGTRYHVAAFDWWPAPGLVTRTGVIPKNDGHPAVQAAVLTPEARGFVQWARFPFFTIREERDAFLVTMDDARYAPVNERSWAALTVRVPKRPAEAGRDVGDAPRPRGASSVAPSPAVPVMSVRATPETVPGGLAALAWHAQRALRLWCRP